MKKILFVLCFTKCIYKAYKVYHAMWYLWQPIFQDFPTHFCQFAELSYSNSCTVHNDVWFLLN
jgi:hypothetical protein